MTYTVIDLFSGAGGLTEGFTEENFNIITHIEKEKWACETLKTRMCFHWLRKNNQLSLYNDYLKQMVDIYQNPLIRDKIILNSNPELKILVEERVINKGFAYPALGPNDITSDDAIIAIENVAANNNISDISVVIGGPPCQAYSLIGRGRMKDQAAKDMRNYLFEYYLDIVNAFKPKIFVFENVPGILTAKEGTIFLEIRQRFEEIGYGITSGRNENDQQNIVETHDLGIYQSRKRVILFGYQKSFFPNGFVYPDFSEYCQIPPEDFITENVIMDLPRLQINQGHDFWYKEYDTEAFSEYQSQMRKDSPGVVNHKARSHRTEDLQIYKHQIEAVNEGRKILYSQLPKELQFHKNKDKKVFEDRFRVHGAKELPHTIVAHISKDGHYNIHPDISQLRSLTVREAARIQSFPDNYVFEGPRTWQFTQVGNAVPPKLSSIIAKATHDILQEQEKKMSDVFSTDRRH